MLAHLEQTLKDLDPHAQQQRGPAPSASPPCSRQVLQLYLSACQLLHTVQSLPPDLLPHVQLSVLHTEHS